MVDSEFINDNRSILESMKKIPIMKSFDEPELQHLLNLSEVMNFNAGDRILKEGGYDGRIYYLISGKVRIVKRAKTLIDLQRIGDVFGEMGFLEGKASSASVYAVDGVSCLAINVSDIERFSGKSKFAVRYIIYREFAEILAGRLRQTTEELARAKTKLAAYEGKAG